mgnify:CR=1 FL=1
MKHYKSYFENERECLKAILEIHNNGKTFDCDPMFNKGNFYKIIEKPKRVFDLKPIVEGCEQANAENLPLESNSINSIVLDPPFMICTRESQRNFYSSKTHSYYNSNEDLIEGYKNLLKEAYRVLKNKGLCVFKCQDYTDSKTIMTHCIVYNIATELGFYAKDFAILNIPKSKVYNGNTKQRHLRKVHTYFWVFVKKGEINASKMD